MKIINTLLFLFFVKLTGIAQYKLQEQSPELLKKNNVKEINLKYIKDTLSFITKSELYNQFGFNTEDKIYDAKTGKRTTTYKYRYINDTFLLEKETYFEDSLSWVFKTLIDFDNRGNIIKENFINNKFIITAYTDFTYDRLNRLKSYKHVRKGNGNLLNYDNNLWYSSSTKYKMDTIFENDTIKKINPKINKVNSTIEVHFTYHKDNSIKEVMHKMPAKFSITYTYDKNGNNISRIKKQGKSELKIYACEYDDLNRPLVLHNYFESDSKIIGVGGFLTTNKNDHLITKVFYHSDGLIDYKEQFLNGNYIGKLQYKYTKI